MAFDIASGWLVTMDQKTLPLVLERGESATDTRASRGQKVSQDLRDLHAITCARRYRCLPVSTYPTLYFMAQALMHLLPHPNKSGHLPPDCLARQPRRTESARGS